MDKQDRQAAGTGIGARTDPQKIPRYDRKLMLPESGLFTKRKTCVSLRTKRKKTKAAP